MTKTELISRVADNHNRIATIEVRGENTLLVADTLRDLRNLIQRLQQEPIEEGMSEKE